MKRLLVSDIMTRSPVIITPNTNLMECARIMVKNRVGSLVIVNNKKLVGFISRKDILWAMVKRSKEELSEIKSIDISPRKLATLRPSNTIKEAIKKMKQTRFERLPVINKGELIGIITTRDILSFHPEAYPEIEEIEKIREESEKLQRVKGTKKLPIDEGICEECGNFDALYRVKGELICESCKQTGQV